MSVYALLQVQQTLERVGEELWNIESTSLGELQPKLSRLQAQIKIQPSLEATAKTLRKQPKDKALPNQQATRVGRFLRYVFSKTTPNQTRPIRLRELNCHALILLGLAYKIKDVLELSETEFDFIINDVPPFVGRQNLSQYLYRGDIDKAVKIDIDSEDDDLFKTFLTEYIRLRPSKRKRDETTSDTEELERANLPLWVHARPEKTGSLTGDVYELTVKDIHEVANSGEIQGTPWLTDTYYMKLAPFVTIPISKELCRRYANQRPQMM